MRKFQPLVVEEEEEEADGDESFITLQRMQRPSSRSQSRATTSSKNRKRREAEEEDDDDDEQPIDLDDIPLSKLPNEELARKFLENIDDPKVTRSILRDPNIGNIFKRPFVLSRAFNRQTAQRQAKIHESYENAKRTLAALEMHDTSVANLEKAKMENSREMDAAMRTFLRVISDAFPNLRNMTQDQRRDAHSQFMATPSLVQQMTAAEDAHLSAEAALDRIGRKLKVVRMDRSREEKLFEVHIGQIYSLAIRLPQLEQQAYDYAKLNNDAYSNRKLMNLQNLQAELNRNETTLNMTLEEMRRNDDVTVGMHEAHRSRDNPGTQTASRFHSAMAQIFGLNETDASELERTTASAAATTTTTSTATSTISAERTSQRQSLTNATAPASASASTTKRFVDPNKNQNQNQKTDAVNVEMMNSLA